MVLQLDWSERIFSLPWPSHPFPGHHTIPLLHNSLSVSPQLVVGLKTLHIYIWVLMVGNKPGGCATPGMWGMFPTPPTSRAWRWFCPCRTAHLPTVGPDPDSASALSSSLRFEPFAELFGPRDCTTCAFISWFKEEGWKYFCRLVFVSFAL